MSSKEDYIEVITGLLSKNKISLEEFLYVVIKDFCKDEGISEISVLNLIYDKLEKRIRRG